MTTNLEFSDYSNLAGSFPRKYEFSIFSLGLVNFIDQHTGKSMQLLQTRNVATNTISIELERLLDSTNNQIVRILNNTGISIVRDVEAFSETDIFKDFYKRLKAIVLAAKKNKATAILGFSSLGGYEILEELYSIIPKLKKIYPNIIFVIGGSDFNEAGDPDFLDFVFKNGIDIINIGGAKEFVDFVGTLSEKDFFYRDSSGKICFSTQKQIPENLLLSSDNPHKHGISTGTKIDALPFYEEEFKVLHFFLKDSPCLNSCHYCSNYIHAENTAFKQKSARDSIGQFNTFVNNLEKQDYAVSIDSPNPMQYIDNFVLFLKKIDLSRASIIGFWADYIGLANKDRFSKLTLVIDALLDKYPNLQIQVNFSFDALHEKNDADFIGRTHGSNIVSEEQLKKSKKSFFKFLEYYHSQNRVIVESNLIIHPSLSVEGLYERLAFQDEIKESGTEISNIHVLVPHINSRICNDYKGCYISEHEMASIESGKRLFHLKLSCWGHFFKNSFLLDVYVFYRSLGRLDEFEKVSDYVKNEDLDKLKSDFLLAVLDEKLELLISIKEKYLKFNTLFLRSLLENPIKAINDCMAMKKQWTSARKFILNFISFIINRENYIKEINMDYDSEELKYFLNQMEELKEKYESLK